MDIWVVNILEISIVVSKLDISILLKLYSSFLKIVFVSQKEL